MSAQNHFDVIIIGTGAGTLAYKLARAASKDMSESKS
jgi:choline dehydrogenase-like flavoprotein